MKTVQIGDWLQHANGKYYQVTRIDRLGDGNIHFACGFPHLWEYNNKFKPIPLEKIHLAKNGFEAREETIKDVCEWIKYNNENGGCLFDGWENDLKKYLEGKK